MGSTYAPTWPRFEILEDQIQHRAAIGDDPAGVAVYARQHVVLFTQFDQPFKFGVDLVELLRQCAERLVSPIAELDVPSTVVGGRGEDGFGVRTCDFADGGGDHRDGHAGVVGDLLRFGETDFGAFRF